MTEHPAPMPERRLLADPGRWIGVPLSLLLVALGTASLARVLADPDAASPLLALHRLLILAFYGLILWAYLRRAAARTGSRSWIARAAAAAGTILPVALPPATAVTSSAWLLGLGSVVTITGLTWSVASLRALGPAFSVMPQARSLVRDGPYAAVRHPLYLGELTAALGVVLSGPTVLAVGVWLALVGLQALRAREEERVLTSAFPGYGTYRRDVAYRLVPGVW